VLFHRQFENTLTNEVFVLNDSSTHCVTAVALFDFSFARFKVLKLKAVFSLLICQSLISGAHG
jgi:hypothetical protein